MKKGVSNILLAILILVIGASLTAALAVWLPEIAFEAYPEEAYNKSYLRSRACLSLGDISSESLTIKNCGLVPLSDFRLYIDFHEAILSGIEKLDPQESATIDYSIIEYGKCEEEIHEFYVTADLAESPVLVANVYFFILIDSLPYTIDRSNAYYCLVEDVHIDDQDAITFSSGIQNSTLDCQGYNLDGNDVSIGVNLFGTNTKNNIIKNCNISNFSVGIVLDGINNISLLNNEIKSSSFKGIFSSGSNNIIKNNIVSGSTFDGVWLDLGQYNTIINNTLNNNGWDGLVMEFSSNNTVISNTANGNDDGFTIRTANNTIINNKAVGNDGDGFEAFGKNNILINNTAENNDKNGFFILSLCDNIKLINNTASGNGAGGNYNGFYFEQCDKVIVEDNLAYNNNLANFYLWETNNSNFTNNVLIGGTRGFYVHDSQNNNIKGGSISSGNVDYNFRGAGTTNYFMDSNFTTLKRIYFYDSTSWFNYNNESSGNIWLKTNVSTAANITRELTSWFQDLIQWNDTSSSITTARYNVTGLMPNTDYDVYNNSVLTYTLLTDSNGNLESFTISLPANEEHEIKVEVEEIFFFLSDCSVLDQAGATYYLTTDIMDSEANPCMNVTADFVTLDCQDYTIDGMDIDFTEGIYSEKYKTTVRNCVLTDWFSGIEYVDNSNGLIQNVTATSNTYRGIFFNAVDNSQLIDITANSNDRNGITFWGSSDNQLTNIIASSNDWGGIFIRTGSNNQLTNINATSNAGVISMDGGINFEDANNSQLTNIITDFSSNGVFMESSFNNQLINISANFAVFRGIVLFSSSNNQLTNITTNSNYQGIFLTAYSRNNTINDSHIEKNYLSGIRVFNSGPIPNKFYNNFLNNTKNIDFSGTIYQNYYNITRQTGTRIYSAGTEIGGNYLADPNGNGYSETCGDVDTDGLCDDPYVINSIGPNIDYLPLSDKYGIAPVELQILKLYSTSNDQQGQFSDLTITGSLNAVGSPDNIQASVSGNWLDENWYFVMNDTDYGGNIYYVNLILYNFRQSGWSDDTFQIQCNNNEDPPTSGTWYTLETYADVNAPPTGNINRTLDISDNCGVNTWDKINKTRMKITSTTKTGGEDAVTWYVDAVAIEVFYTT